MEFMSCRPVVSHSGVYSIVKCPSTIITFKADFAAAPTTGIQTKSIEFWTDMYINYQEDKQNQKHEPSGT